MSYQFRSDYFYEKYVSLRSMFPLNFCSLCAQKFWCVRTFLEMTYTCKLGEDQIKKRSSSRIGVVFVPEKFTAPCKNISVQRYVHAQ